MARKQKLKPITARVLYNLIEPLENKNIPVTMVGERQLAYSASLVTQQELGGEFDGGEIPVAIEIQLMPVR